MSIATYYTGGIPHLSYDNETVATLPCAEASEPCCIRNAGPSILTVTPKSGQTVQSGSSLSLAVGDFVVLAPNNKNWSVNLDSTIKLTTDFIGFTGGAGGSVTQTGTINSDVALNRPCGSITLLSNNFGNNDIEKFTLNNSYIQANDIVLVTFKSGQEKLYCQVVNTDTGSCDITVGDAHNQSTGSISVTLNFAVIKGDS